MHEYKKRPREKSKRFRLLLLAAAAVLTLSAVGCVPAIRYADEQPASQPVRPRTQAQEQQGAEQTRRSPESVRRSGRKGSQRLLEEVVASYIGVPYRWGGTTAAGFDCSGFVLTVYREVYGVTLPRTSSRMWKQGRQIPITAARPGDLVFFKGGSFGAVDHVGVYMGGNRFAHSSTSSGVIYSSLSETYYARRFAGARRVQ
jgi:cell wall-associated NlpC family hydrolase